MTMEGPANDEPPNLCKQSGNRCLSLPFHPRGYERTSHSGGTGKYGNRGPLIYLNMLYRGGHLVCYPRSVGSGSGDFCNS